MNFLATLFAVLVFTAIGLFLSTWLVTVLVGAGFQTLGLDGPGWETVFWFVFAARLALVGNVNANAT